ncbi:MAG TPA: phosphoglycerate dehydrogenase [Gemmatimonadaceae bacterium]|jgi:D-3-phosphoglycerate dehydrogenase|nr:phosphoglycerate dehydrogenase [Gemmatimonadaceae bacterium]
MTYRILVTDEIDADGVALLTSEPSFKVDVVPTLPAAELLERIGEYDAFVGRSATRVTDELLRRATKLRVVGRAGVGVDNIALDTATSLGVAVINAPAGNTVAVAELFFGALIGLIRHLPRAATSMREGKWDRSKLLGTEIKGRTLVIVGVGRIGSEVATRALAFGMDVAGYDPYVGDERFRALRIRRIDNLDEAVETADVLTVHTPLTDETLGMIGKRELGKMKSGAIVMNLARGGIIEETALLAALESGKLNGAIVDAFSKEPLAPDHPLRSAPNTFLMPHLGASTAEAQRNVAVDACAAVRDALLHGELSRSINVAGAGTGDWKELQNALVVVRRAASVARAILADRGVKTVQRLSLRVGPELAGASAALLASAAAGTLEGTIDVERLNLINARSIAEARGIELSTTESDALGHPAAMLVSVSGGVQLMAVAAVAPEGAPARLIRIGGFHIDVAPREALIILTNNDVPGVIGRVGTLLGDRGVNIAEYHQARLAQGGEALAAISVDGVVPAGVRDELLGLQDVCTATIVHFRGA